MKVGMHDDLLFSLQGRFLQEGHSVVVCGDFECPPDALNVSGVKPLRGQSITQVRTVNGLMDSDCDFHLAMEGNTWEMLVALGKPALGYSAAVVELENDRSFAQRVMRASGADKYIHLPEQQVFSEAKDAVTFLEGSRKSWVLKKAANSPKDEVDNRTLVSPYPYHDQVISFLPHNRAWFNTDGTGGVVLEEYIEGHEVCFGWWFNGTQFTGPLYACEEHKGAQNNDRGALLTGEVGGWFRNCPSDGTSPVHRMFRALEPFLKGRCRGIIDINTIIRNGKMNFLEFTCRFGRPTLEYWLGSLNEQDKVTPFLHSLAQGGSPAQVPTGSKYAVGVTVFSYGIPLKVENPVPSVRFKPPVSRMTGGAVVFQQLFCRHKKGSWYTEPEERQFTLVGRSNRTMENARDSAYICLDGYHLLGCTWRDDVGSNYPEIEDQLELLLRGVTK